MRIFIVEDDTVIAHNLKTLLKRENFSIDLSDTVQGAYQKIIDTPYDAIIIDWILHDQSGVDLLKKIRNENNQTPVLLLTAKGTVSDKVTGFHAGADDYLTKPFSFDELLVRIKALLRRRDKPLSDTTLKVSDLTIHTNSNEVYRNGKKIDVSPKEYALLEYLALNVGTAISRIDLLSHVWDEEVDLFSNTVDVHITYLRKKIDEGHAKKLIQTVKGKGYMLCA